MTYLPARDGEGHGTIKRSNTAPNSSYFTNWTSKDDSITWDIEVGQAGDYDATIHYTCAASDANCTIEASFLASKTSRAITEAHDPALRGAEIDRVFRGPESYAKDFKPLSLGTFSLAKGRGPLTLRALNIPGKQAIDVRYIILSRKG